MQLFDDVIQIVIDAESGDYKQYLDLRCVGYLGDDPSDTYVTAAIEYYHCKRFSETQHICDEGLFDRIEPDVFPMLSIETKQNIIAQLWKYREYLDVKSRDEEE
jgi:hypothetical protein